MKHTLPDDMINYGPVCPYFSPVIQTNFRIGRILIDVHFYNERPKLDDDPNIVVVWHFKVRKSVSL